MKQSRRRIKYLILITAAAINLLILSSFVGLTLEQDKIIKRSVELSANRLFENIVLTRRWNANYGGVFVHKSDDVISNPYLDHPDITTSSGLRYTLKNPALMTREISKLASQSGLFEYHITSLKLLNPHNEPDKWEKQALMAFERGETERSEIVEVGDTPHYRLMRPLVFEDGCLQCHAQQGYEKGEIRGGISVSLPFAQAAKVLATNRIKMFALAAIIVIVFSVLFYFFIWRLATRIINVSSDLEEQKKQLEELNAGLDDKVEKRTTALRESEKRFRSTFEQAPIGVCHISLNGKFMRLNHAFSGIIGFSERELRKKLFQDIFSGEELYSILEISENLRLVDAKTSTVEMEYTRPDHSKIKIIITISLIRKDDGDPDYFIIILKDISESRKLQKQLQQAQKLESIGTLAGGIAHDFNNVLTPILGYTELCVQESDQESKHFAYLHEIQSAAIRARELTSQILIFSRQENYSQTPLDITLIIKEVYKLLRSSLPSSIEMTMEREEGDYVICADPIQIHQILMNLCTNASHAIGNKAGKIVIKLCKLRLTEKTNSKNLAPGEYVSLEIADTGCGMDQATIDRIYDPYFTTKKQGEGTGLGLAVVHGIVNDLRGMLTVYSEVGLGTAFRILLPLIEKDPGELPVSEESNDMRGGTENILLVDDEPMITSMQHTILTELGYNVTARIDSESALRLFQEDPDKYDLVITDMTMPKITGLTLAREVHALRPNLPVILCTGYNAEIIDKTGNESRFFAFLTKPIMKNVFCRTVREALDEGSQ